MYRLWLRVRGPWVRPGWVETLHAGPTEEAVWASVERAESVRPVSPFPEGTGFDRVVLRVGEHPYRLPDESGVDLWLDLGGESG